MVFHLSDTQALGRWVFILTVFAIAAMFCFSAVSAWYIPASTLFVIATVLLLVHTHDQS